MHAFIRAIEYHLPEEILNTEQLSVMFPEWSVEKIDLKTGIHQRHITAPDEYASDLAVGAAKRLFKTGICGPEEIDFLLLCTQSPDYALPATACLLQNRLGIPSTAGALDYNLGCSGFVYGLGISEGLIATEQAETILLITADTYSKYIRPSDKTSRTIFGDGAAATLLQREADSTPSIGPFLYGTDGGGADNLIVRGSGTRKTFQRPSSGAISTNDFTGFLFMDGARVFQFAIDTIPDAVASLLKKAGMTRDQIDLFVFHQANAYLLNEVCNLLRIPREKCYICLGHCANTVSSTIPIALKNAETDGVLRKGQTLMLVGFGVGYSWSATILRWK